MKKADNFDATKWLVENKITTQSKLNEVKNKSVLDFVKQNLDSVMSEISNITGGNSYYKKLAKMVKSNPALMSGDENLVQFKDQDKELGLYDTFQVAFNRK
jgi:vacuolar-type H+-ATPase subunit E/Vma4